MQIGGDTKWCSLFATNMSYWPHLCRAIGKDSYIKQLCFSLRYSRERLLRQNVAIVNCTLTQKRRDSITKRKQTVYSCSIHKVAIYRKDYMKDPENEEWCDDLYVLAKQYEKMGTIRIVELCCCGDRF